MKWRFWALMCLMSRHEWRPVYVHHVVADGTTRSLVRCYRRAPGGRLCLVERYTDSTSGQWTRGSQG